MATTRTATRPTILATVTTTAKVNATTTTDVKLDTRLRTKLLGYLGQYATVAGQIKELKAGKDDLTAAIRKLRESTGASSLDLEGFKMTDVGGDSFDRDATYKKLMSMHGLTIEDIKACEVHKPKKRFEKITCPGGGDE